MGRRLPLIYNPQAGGMGERRALKAARTFEKLGADVEVFATTASGSAEELARSVAASGAERLAVAGGDGTINEVVNGIAGSDTELAIIPIGTANVLAIELGIPLSVSKACELALSGKPTRVDLGLAGKRYFVLMAGFGFDALVIKNINPVLKRAIRHAAFPVTGLVTFIQEDLPLLRVESGDHVTEGYFVIAANSKYYGGRFGPTPDASMTDGLLDIVVLKDKGLAEMVNFWISALRKAQLDEPVAEYFRAETIDVSCPSGQTVLWQTDGEVVGELPVRLRVVPGALKVITGDME